MKLDYDEISPITGNKCVVVEADEKANLQSYLCMESGYTTTDQLIKGGPHIEQFESQITELMLDLKHEDEETDLAWYPTFMQMPGGMLYPEGTHAKWEWRVAKIIPITGEDRLKYPVPGKEGEYHTSRLDVDNASIYNNIDFATALEELYDIVKGVIEHEN